jgi:small-conductance mechanosensitive channel
MAAGRIAFWLGLVIGTVIAPAILGINLGLIIATLLVGFLVLSFALRGYIENFAAGLVLQARRPFRPDHLISVNEYHGEVREINNRIVVVYAWDGRRLYLPSKAVLDSVIVNHTVRGQRRTRLDVGVAYDSDLAEARRVLLEATSNIEGVLSNPPTRSARDEVRRFLDQLFGPFLPQASDHCRFRTPRSGGLR